MQRESCFVFFGFSFFQGVPGSWKLLTQWRPHLSKPLQKQRNHSLILHIKMIGMVCEYDCEKKYSEGNKEKYNWSLLYTLGLDQQLCSSFVSGEYGNTSLCKSGEPLLAIR